MQAYVFEASHLSDPDADLVHSIQGLLNRYEAKLFVSWRKELGHLSKLRNEQWVDNAETAWLEFTAERYGIEYTPLSTIDELLELVKPVTTGYVLSDPLIPETRNLACTIAGLETLIMACPEHIELLDSKGFVCGEDLRGLFWGKPRSEVTRWAWENLFPRCHPKHVLARAVPDIKSVDISAYAGNTDGFTLKLKSLHRADGDVVADLAYLAVMSADGEMLYERDRRAEVATHYQTGGLPETSEKEISSEQLFKVDCKLPETVFLAMQCTGTYEVSINRHGGGDYHHLIASRPVGLSYGQGIGYVCDFEPFMRDLAISNRWFCFDLNSNPGVADEYALRTTIMESLAPNGVVFGWHSECSDEHQHVQHASTHGNGVCAALSAHNFSFMQHLKGGANRVPDMPPVPEVDPEKIYLTFIVADGDAMGIGYHLYRGMFLEEGRGQVPLNWGIQMLLKDYAPPVLAYILEHASEHDGFVASISGLGYCYADCMTLDKLKDYVGVSGQYLRELNIKAIHYCGDPEICGGRGMSDEGRELYDRVLGDQITGVIDGYWCYGGMQRPDSVHERIYWSRLKLPDASVWGAVEQDKMREALLNLKNQKKEGEPIFVPVHPWIDRKIGPDWIKTVVEEMGDGVEVVRGDHFLAMMKRWSDHNS